MLMTYALSFSCRADATRETITDTVIKNPLHTAWQQQVILEDVDAVRPVLSCRQVYHSRQL